MHWFLQKRVMWVLPVTHTLPWHMQREELPGFWLAMPVPFSEGKWKQEKRQQGQGVFQHPFTGHPPGPHLQYRPPSSKGAITGLTGRQHSEGVRRGEDAGPDT